MAKLAKGSKVLKPFVVASLGDNNLQNDIDNWIKGLERLENQTKTTNFQSTL